MSDAKLIWYGHGTCKLITPSGKKILVDPFLNGNPACPTELRDDRDIDVLLITHGHGDHFGDTLLILKESKAIALTIFEMAHFLYSKGVAQSKVMGFNIGGTIELEGINITMTPALHSSVIYDGNNPVQVGPPVGFVIRMEDDRTIYFAGDTDIFSEMQFIGEMHAPVMAVLPIDGYYNMSPKAAARAVQILGSKQVFPIHQSTFPVLWGKPSMLRTELENLGLSDVKVHVPNPGEIVVF